MTDVEQNHTHQQGHSHRNSHSHSHHHHHGAKDQTIGRLWVSILLNLIITIAEVVGGLISNSLALLSDALHNLNDTLSLVIALVARKIAGKDPNKSKTFGYKRAEIIGAFINLITLVIIAFYLINEGIQRFFDPQPIDGWVMFWVAIVGLLGNFITAFLLWKSADENLNLRSAFIHILSDGLSSVGVIIGGWLIIEYQLHIVDTILTLMIGLYILWHSYHMLDETIQILMASTPPNLDVDQITQQMEAQMCVQDVHHVHVWRLNEQQVLLEAHVLVDKSDMEQMEEIKRSLKEMLLDDFDIDHTTLEFEFEDCADLQTTNCH
ncbi:MAG: cation diffusion facilitator family transporter [Bacteroidota bacterium]